MPKAQPHFDAVAILQAVAAQDIGLEISTNNPVRWRAIMYAAMRAAEHLRCYIYASPRSANSFFLLKQRADGAPVVGEPQEPADVS